MSPPALHCPLCHAHYLDSSFRRCPHDGTPLLTADGTALGWIGEIVQERYRVDRFLGKGGMAQVYEACHLATGRKVAIKIVQPRMATDPAVALERFRREAQLLSRITHPNVVAIEDFGSLPDGALFMVMELLQGRSLQQELDEREVTLAEAIDIALEVCEAVQAAHESGIAHRDIKPANVFLETLRSTGARPIKVLDFGISKIVEEGTTTDLTKAGTIFGTPEYMSPQQAHGHPADLSSDIYSIGILLYRMLLGTVPFTGESYLQVLVKHLTEHPPWPADEAARRKLPAPTRDVLFRALEKNPDDRYESVAAFAAAIRSLRHRPSSTSYSVVNEEVDRVRIRETVPPSSTTLRTTDLQQAKGWDTEVARIAPDVFWVGRRTGGALECNTYLRVFRKGNQRVSVLIDPGPPRDLKVIGQKVASVIGSIAEVDLLFVNHQDPDVSFNTLTFQQLNPNAHVICSEHTWRLIHLMGLELQHHSAIEHYPDCVMHLVTGHQVVFVPTPFCHFRGAAMFYDTSSRVLFTGDLFGGLSRSKHLLAQDRTWEGVDAFHQIYMPNNQAVRRAIEKIRRLDPPPRFLAPQHGVIFGEDQIEDLLAHLEDLPMGMDLQETEALIPSFCEAASELIGFLKSQVGTDPVRKRLRRFAGDGTFPDLFVFDDDLTIRDIRIEPKAATGVLLRELAALVPKDQTDPWVDAVEAAQRRHGIRFSR